MQTEYSHIAAYEGTEIADAAKIADDHNQHVGEILAPYLPENRSSGRTRRLAIIVGPILFLIGSKHIRIAHVAGIVILFSVVLQQYFNLLERTYRMGEGKEFRTLVFIQSFRFRCYGKVRICDFCVQSYEDFLKYTNNEAYFADFLQENAKGIAQLKKKH